MGGTGIMEKKRRDYSKTEKGVINKIFFQQLRSSKKRGHEPPEYSRKEFYEWVVSNDKWNKLFNEWKNNNFETMKKPSVDRLDDKKGYCFKNIRLVTWKENLEKQWKKDETFYNEKSTQRSDFKISCKKQGWNFEDFKETFSGEKTNCGHKKYFYEKVRK